MRIAILSYEYPPETGFGGIGTYAYYQARALAKIGHNVHVFAGSTKNGVFHSEHEGVKVTRIKREGVVNGLLDNARKTRAWWFQNRVTTATDAYEGLAKEHAKKPFDFIEAPECGADAMVASTFLTVPVAVRFHSPARLIMNIYDTPKIDRVLTAFAEQLGINQAKVLTSCSKFLADEVASKMGETDPIHVIPNGIDVPLFDRDEGIDVFTKFGLPRDKKIIFFANRMEERKGIHIVQKMVEATLAKYPDIAFAFAGRDLFGFMEKKILPWVKDSQLQDRFFYLGQLALPEVRAVRAHMRQFSDRVRAGLWRGFSGEAIRDVVNIGIGGSDLGPRMATEALAAHHIPDFAVEYVSNLDSAHLARVLAGATPEETLFLHFF